MRNTLKHFLKSFCFSNFEDLNHLALGCQLGSKVMLNQIHTKWSAGKNNTHHEDLFTEPNIVLIFTQNGSVASLIRVGQGWLVSRGFANEQTKTEGLIEHAQHIGTF